MLAGLVRVIEVCLVAAVGFAVYVCYVVPSYGFAWYYFAAIARHRASRHAGVPDRRYLSGPGLPRPREAIHAARPAWSVVFLIAISVSFFAKAGDQFSRAWLGAFYVLGLFALIAFRRGLFLMVRRWTHEGRLDRRTVIVGCDSNGEKLIRSLGAQREFRRAADRRVRRPQRRAQPPPHGVPKLGTVDDLVDFARTPASIS